MPRNDRSHAELGLIAAAVTFGVAASQTHINVRFVFDSAEF